MYGSWVSRVGWGRVGNKVNHNIPSIAHGEKFYPPSRDPPILFEIIVLDVHSN